MVEFDHIRLHTAWRLNVRLNVAQKIALSLSCPNGVL